MQYTAGSSSKQCNSWYGGRHSKEDDGGLQGGHNGTGCLTGAAIGGGRCTAGPGDILLLP